MGVVGLAETKQVVDICCILAAGRRQAPHWSWMLGLMGQRDMVGVRYAKERLRESDVTPSSDSAAVISRQLSSATDRTDVA